MAHNYNAPRNTGTNSPIARARRAKGWTQEQLANILEVKPPIVSQWETGVRVPKVKTLMRIADALGVEWTQLVNED